MVDSDKTRFNKDFRSASDRYKRTDHSKSQSRAHLKSYTEKSLLVLKNYIYFEKSRKKINPAFTCNDHSFMNDSLGSEEKQPYWKTKFKKNTENQRGKSMRAGKNKCTTRSWMPNGGSGVKPNSYQYQNTGVSADDCLIDFTAVKPKVDTWFKPKLKEALDVEPSKKIPLNSWIKPKINPPAVREFDKLVKVSEDTRPSTDQRWENEKAEVRQPEDAAAITKDGDFKTRERDAVCRLSKNVQSLTSFWNDHMKQYPHPTVPFTFQQPSKMSQVQKSESVIKRQKSSTIRPKSEGSDGVVQEHTLLPSTLTTEKRKLSSLEDILAFVKKKNSCRNNYTLTKYTNISGSTSTQHNPIQCKQRITMDEQVSTHQIDVFDSERATCLRNPSNEQKIRKNKHPRYILRLRPRFLVMLRVLALTIKPLLFLWKQEYIQWNTVQRSLGFQAMKSTKQRIYPNDRQENQKPELDKGEWNTSADPTLSGQYSQRVRNLKQLAKQGMEDTLCYLQMLRNKPNCSPIQNDNAETFKRTSLDKFHNGVRITVYVEYNVMFYFIVVQLMLFLIVLFIKCLQKYSAF